MAGYVPAGSPSTGRATVPLRMSGDVCALCGKAVDWNDYEVRENGVIVCGNYYPSIDHIVPVSGEGLHAWGNVQLAHRICNTRKGATLPMA